MNWVILLFLLTTFTTSSLPCMTESAARSGEITEADIVVFREYFSKTKKPYRAISKQEGYGYEYTNHVDLSNKFFDAVLNAFDGCFSYAREQMLNEAKVIDRLADVIKELGFDLETLAIEMWHTHELPWETRTLLQRAAEMGKPNVIQTLHRAGAKIDAQSKRGKTALHLAAKNGHVPTCKLLLDLKASINVKAQYNWTPLHSAAKAGKKDVCILLLAAGADRNAGGRGGYDTPENLAWGEAIEAFK